MTIEFDELKNSNLTVREYMKQTGKNNTSLNNEILEATELLKKLGCEENAGIVESLNNIDYNAVSRQLHREAGIDIQGTQFNKRRDERELDKFNKI